jgi:Flp pilus assembly protein TadD
VLWRKGLAEEASDHFRQAVEFQPDNARAHTSLGDALNQAGDLAGARTVLERAVQLDPHDAKAHHLLGRVYDRLGHPDEARAMYQRSRELTGA